MIRSDSDRGGRSLSVFLLVAPLLLAQDAVKVSPRNANAVEATITANHGSDAVLDWNNTALTAIETLELPPPIAGYCMAMAHAAIFDAVDSIIGDYQPYVTKVSERRMQASRRGGAAGH